MKKCILSVVGKDKVGITAGVCSVLANAQVNILDINQTILQEYFTMVVLVDIDTSDLGFGEIAERLEAYGRESGMEIHIQREEIFDAMHRI
ncbi:MAG: ACT domain-containing protein [Firmicutes bacterium]|nr:ACT domain-containing protein [Bacillota bacterium]